MSQTINTVVYNTFRTNPDSVVLASSSHTLSSTDTLQLSRVFPKPTKTDAGVARPRFKRVKTFTLGDGTKRDGIIEVSGSIPVGAADADILALLDDVADGLALQDQKDLFTKLDINS